jgi:outer membrane lipoprotein-sorting protein
VHLRRVVLLLTAGLVGVVVAACGGSSQSSSSSDNGVSSKSPQEILSAANAAINDVSAVHVSGSVTSSGSAIKMNLDLAAGKGAKGQMSQNGMSFQLVTDGKSVYINAGSAFWRQIGGSGAAQLLQGKWLKAPATSGDFASLASLTDVHKLLSALLNNHGHLVKGATTTVNGQKVVAVKDPSTNGTLYVATSGKAYPVEVSKSGTDGGSISFDRFNEPVSVSPPANAIDIASLKSK